MTDLVDLLVALASERSDGHITIMKFTTNWRVSLGTPNDRGQISEMAVGNTFEEAVLELLANEPSRPKVDWLKLADTA